MSSSTSSGTTWVLFHVDWYLGCTGTGGGKRLSASAWDFSLDGVAPLLLRREKRGIVARSVTPSRLCERSNSDQMSKMAGSCKNINWRSGRYEVAFWEYGRERGNVAA